MLGGWDSGGKAGAGRASVGLTEVLQHAVTLQLCVSDLVLKQNQLLLVLVFECLQPSLAVLQLVDQLLLDLDLTCQVGQVGLEVHLCGVETGSIQCQGLRAGRGCWGLSSGQPRAVGDQRLEARINAMVGKGFQAG